MRAAVTYLGRYASSVDNLRRVLKRKVARVAQALDSEPDEFDEMIERVVARCQALGLVDDRAYAESKVASLRRRGRSARQIAAQLGAKGVDRATLDQALNADPVEDVEAARNYARRRRLGPWRSRGDRDENRQRDMAALCRAGFGFDVARTVIDASAETPE